MKKKWELSEPYEKAKLNWEGINKYVIYDPVSGHPGENEFSVRMRVALFDAYSARRRLRDFIQKQRVIVGD